MCRLYADFVWEFSLPAKAALSYHRFKRGDTVLLAPLRGGSWLRRSRDSGSSRDSGNDSDGGDGPAMAAGELDQLEGTVLEIGRQQLQITVSKPVAEVLGAAPPGSCWGGEGRKGRVAEGRQG